MSAAEASSSVFGQAADAFAHHGEDTLRGAVRYETIHRNLANYLDAPDLQIIDVQGGSGIDTTWLALQGHHVTMLEVDPEQRALAETRFSKLPDSVRERIQVVPGDLPGATLPRSHYDRALCHVVASYKKDPAAYVANVCELLSKNGIISLVEDSYAGAEARFVRSVDDHNLRSLQTNSVYINNLNYSVTAFKPEELTRILQRAQTDVIRWSGVRVMTDASDLLVKDLQPQQLDAIFDAEYRQGNDVNCRGLGSLLHFIARKR